MADILEPRKQLKSVVITVSYVMPSDDTPVQAYAVTQVLRADLMGSVEDFFDKIEDLSGVVYSERLKAE